MKGPFYVDRAGVVRAGDEPLYLKSLRQESVRVEGVRVSGHVPAEVGPAVEPAPARGAVRMFEPMSLYPDGEDDYVLRPSGYRGRKALRRCDAFDLMQAKAAAKGRSLPFTVAQVEVGRLYADLVHRHNAAGVKCSSIEGRVGGSGRGGDFIDAVLRDRERIDLFRRRIGAGAAMVVRKVRPSSRGTRVAIMDRALVDAVCVEEQTLSDVLRAHGWSVKGQTVQAVGRALADALQRMIGPVGGGGIRAARYGEGASIFGREG